MALSDVEVRVLGALMEKERTTPDGYPLSSQALVTACNQRTNRDPVTDYHLQDVMAAVTRLRDRGLAETVQEVGDRVPKHRHKAARALELDARQFAVLAVLMLRGEQTPGELRSRTERYTSFDSVAEVERVLDALASRRTPLARNLGRAPGQSQDRFTHTLGADEERLSPRVRARGAEESRTVDPDRAEPAAPPPAASTATGDVLVTSAAFQELADRVAALERRVRALETGE